MTTVPCSPAIIGIDLGTTYSCVGVFRNGQVEIFENDHGSRTTPTCVVFDESQRLIGEAAKNLMAVHSTNTVYDAKRFIGRRFDDPIVQSDLHNFSFTVIDAGGKLNVQVNYKGETKSFHPEEISAMVLFQMKETAEVHLGMPVPNAVITVPAYFNDSQRRATIEAGFIAGFKGLAIINEPTAAALAYGYRFKDGKRRTILIFDLGGGTLDVSIISIRDGEFRVLSTAGDTHLGGEDFNTRLVNHFIEEFKIKHNIDLSKDKRVLISLRMACEKAKLCLSSTTNASITIESFHSSITRDRFEELNADLFKLTIDIVKKAIQDAGITKTDIEDVILVGGSTRIPKIRILLQDFFDGKELSKTINPDEAVAQGAVIRAAMINRDTSDAVRNLIVHDITTFNIGYLKNSGNRSRIIDRNSVLPIKETVKFKTYHELPTWKLKVYECDHQDPNLLDLFVFHGIPLSPRGLTEVCVTFNILHNGVLYLTGTENSSGTWNSITVTNTHNFITQEEKQRMIADAERYRLDDLEHRKRAAARNDLELYCYNTRSSIERFDQSLKGGILDMIEQTIQWLENGPLNSVEEIELKKTNIQHMLNSPTIPSPDYQFKVSSVEEVMPANSTAPHIVTQENHVTFLQGSSQIASPVEEQSTPSADRGCLETSL